MIKEKKYRTFSREFKLDILSQLQHKGKAQVCREHNLQPQVVNRWLREQRDYPKEAFKGKGKMYKLEGQLAEAQRVIGQLCMENELLKKSISFLKEKEAEEKMLRSTQ